jgi:hypothetical protein
VTSSVIANEDDDQLFYTKVYLTEELRNKFHIKLDHRADIFQNLNGAVGEPCFSFIHKVHILTDFRKLFPAKRQGMRSGHRWEECIQMVYRKVPLVSTAHAHGVAANVSGDKDGKM